MKKLVLALLVLTLSGGTALAAGGKNHGETGKGKVHQSPQTTSGKTKAAQQHSGR